MPIEIKVAEPEIYEGLVNVLSQIRTIECAFYARYSTIGGRLRPLQIIEDQSIPWTNLITTDM